MRANSAAPARDRESGLVFRAECTSVCCMRIGCAVLLDVVFSSVSVAVIVRCNALAIHVCRRSALSLVIDWVYHSLMSLCTSTQTEIRRRSRMRTLSGTVVWSRDTIPNKHSGAAGQCALSFLLLIPASFGAPSESQDSISSTERFKQPVKTK